MVKKSTYVHNRLQKSIFRWLIEGYQRVSHETIRNEFLYIDEITLCNKGRSRYMSGLAHSHKFNIGDEFAATVCSLPTTYDQSTYMKFLQDWGTVCCKAKQRERVYFYFALVIISFPSIFCSLQHVVMETEIGWETKTRKRIAVEDVIQVLIKTVRSFSFFFLQQITYHLNIICWFGLESRALGAHWS